MKPLMNKTHMMLAQAKSLQQNNQLQQAKEIYKEIIKAEPNNVDALHLFGILHQQLKEYDTAISYFEKVKKLSPNIPQLYHNLGLTYKEKGDFHTAIKYYQQALKLKPDYASVYEKLGNTFICLGEYQTAIDNYQKSLQLRPNNAECWNNCGSAFQAWDVPVDAEECFRNALKLDPNFIKALVNLSAVLRTLNKIEEPIKHLNKVLSLEPDCNEAFTSLYAIYENICHWENYQENQEKLLQLHRNAIAVGNKSPINPMTAFTYNWPAAELLACAQSSTKHLDHYLTANAEKINFTFSPQQKDRLKIGYLSSDFHTHPVAYLTNNLYALHNRKEFEVYGFSIGSSKDKSSYRKHIQASCDHFIDLFLTKDIEAAKQIYNSGIDILIDLNGHTRGARMNILALRPAPIQAHYLGFLGSSGANFMDYILADEIVIPPATASVGYSEKPVYLPCYQIFDDQQPISDKVLTRKDYGLPEDSFVYCCHNNTYKILPKIFSIWMEILAKTPNSVLWLLGTSILLEENLRREAQQHNIDPSRLIFVKSEERQIYLARYRLADLFLDTPFYNANTTGSDALWAGLPLLTYPTENFAGRGAASALTALGLPELVMPTLEAYRDTAIYFYENRTALQKICEKIQKNRSTHLLFNTKATVQYIEQAYWQMWEIFRKGEKPRTIKIESGIRERD